MTAVADAIRSKTGGSDPLSFPTGFSDAIAGISGGGGGSDAVSRLMAKRLKGLLSPNATPEHISITSSDFDGVDLIEYFGQEVVPPYFFYNTSIRSLTLDDSRLYAVSMFDSCNMFYATEISIAPTCSFYGSPFKSATYVPGWPVGFNPTRTPTSMFNSATFSKDVVVPEGVETIAGGCLSSVTRAQSTDTLTVTLPASLTKVESGYGVISGTSSKPLSLVMLGATPPVLGGATSLTQIGSITVPAGSLQAYQEATNWAQFADIMVEASA